MAEYIEREAAIELLSEPITMSMCLSTEECHHKIAQQRIDRYLIESIPAADVRPAVRGKWRERRFSKNAYGFECSVCHTTWDSVTSFCPFCGADMRPQPPKEE
jgi:hypothetical protein